MNESTKTAVKNAVKEATFGVEIEYNESEHPSFNSGEWSWLESNGHENIVIRERCTKPTTLFKHLRRQCMITELLGHQYDTGNDDPRAGSLHTHVQISSVDNNDVELEQLNPLLAFADHMKRTSEDVFRDAYDYRARLDVQEHDDQYEEHDEVLPEDTKRYWICHNTGVDTIENRLVESAASYVNTLLMPLVIYDIGYSVSQDVVRELNGERPSVVAKGVRDSFDYTGFMCDAITVYSELNGELLSDTGPKTDTYEALPVRILSAALGGATSIEIHKQVVLPVFEDSRVFRNMIGRAA